MARTIAAHPPRRLAGGKASSPRERSARGPLGLAHGAAGALRAGVLRVRRTRRLRLALLALTITLVVLAGGWLLLRHSPFVSIERVQISGVHGADAAAVEAALTHAAKGMSTLDVSRAGLQAAVAPLRVVREVRAIPSFPHGLRIDVVEQLPVAALQPQPVTYARSWELTCRMAWSA